MIDHAGGDAQSSDTGLRGGARTILVTGGAGFIGSNLIHMLQQRHPGDNLLVLDLLTYAGNLKSLPDSFRFMEDAQKTFWHGDVRYPSLVETLVDQADVVIHLAAETHVTRSIFDNQTFIETDVIGTHTLLNAIVKRGGGIRRFVHVSTSEVYGSSQSDRMTEDHPLNPQSPYAAAKCAADRLVYSYVQTYGIPAVTIRPFNNFGPRQHLEKLVPRFITSTMLNEPISIHGSGNSARDFVYVEDTCDAILKVLDAPDALVHGEVFNVASGIARSVNEIADDVTALHGTADVQRIFIEERPGQVSRHCGSADKIRDTLGWTPGFGWEDGLRTTYDWYEQNRDWWSSQMNFRSIPIMNAAGKLIRH